jgi:hypothetical protein
MMHKYSPKVRMAKAPSGGQSQGKGWWRQNWIALASFAVAAVGLGVSIWAVRVSLAADRRAQRGETEVASAEATLFADNAGWVYAIANFSHAVALHAQGEERRDRRLSPDTLSQFKNGELPSLSPTTDEIEALARVGDDTASHLVLCVKWRNTAEGIIETLVQGNGQIVEPIQTMEVNLLVPDLSNTAKACLQAANDLARHAIPDPTGPDISSGPPVVLKRIYPTQAPPPRATGMN